MAASSFPRTPVSDFDPCSKFPNVIAVLASCRTVRASASVRARRGQLFRLRPRGLGLAQDRLELVGARRDLAVERLDRLLRALAPFGGLAAGVLRALAGVDGVAEGLAVVALIDRLVRLLERVDRGGEFVGGEPVGAGASGEIDGGLRLIDLFLRRLGTARHGQEHTDGEQATDHGGKV